ncbi:NAD(P)H-hydrate dehydratase [Ruminococcus sp. OA3]|uniref:NAD(P)H-hydrate dehydratase n=1 Tax=Ruminococcus sp. OA3 TaxID=2914164 RepID=UPI001F05C407|nr:NAD(P)H-hydrate dehydratase [Ruminococcus sp. OA3]MCH1983394.1 NAD(P)H-hydrate dehydratase [Ruminococcus sp. OA3]
MRRVVTTRQMKEADEYTIRKMGIPSLVLMERAALACVEVLEREFPLEQVLILCGTGNNGGDGIAIGRILHLAGYDVSICLTGSDAHRSEENKTQKEIAENYGTTFVNNPDPAEYTTIVDSVFGIGLSRKLSPQYCTLFQKVNASCAKVLAVDIPSGIHGNTAEILGAAIRADVTVTFAFAKPGLLMYPGADFAGRLKVCDIGIYEVENTVYQPDIHQIDKKDRSWMKRRNPGGNKGTFGKILLIAGSVNMCGASYLSGMAGFLTGAGMVKIHTVRENRVILQQQFPEAMLSVYDDGDPNLSGLDDAISWADVIGIGPGLGTSRTAEKLLDHVLAACRVPLVIDADGLNLLSRDTDRLKGLKCPCIVTPHLGEMSRLTKMGISQIQKDRLKTASEFARNYHTVCVQKDARTVIADPDGMIFINTSGNSGMATAGSGDVLTGMILGLLGSGMPAREAAALGVWLHGCAGEAASRKAGEASVMAGNLLEEIPDCIKNDGNNTEEGKV